MRPVFLPAGLEDKDLEIYLYKGNLRVIFAGQIIKFEDLPAEILDCFTSHLIANKAAMASLRNDFKLADTGEMLTQYIKCNFGNFDGAPDRTTDGVIITECWDCGNRGHCAGEGKICSRLQGPNGMLTKRETEIFFLLIDGKYDKEIAAIFNVTLATVETQLKLIRLKLACSNRIEIMNYAMHRKLVII